MFPKSVWFWYALLQKLINWIRASFHFTWKEKEKAVFNRLFKNIFRVRYRGKDRHETAVDYNSRYSRPIFDFFEPEANMDFGAPSPNLFCKVNSQNYKDNLTKFLTVDFFLKFKIHNHKIYNTEIHNEF